MVRHSQRDSLSGRMAEPDVASALANNLVATDAKARTASRPEILGSPATATRRQRPGARAHRLGRARARRARACPRWSTRWRLWRWPTPPRPSRPGCSNQAKLEQRQRTHRLGPAPGRRCTATQPRWESISHRVGWPDAPCPDRAVAAVPRATPGTQAPRRAAPQSSTARPSPRAATLPPAPSRPPRSAPSAPAADRRSIRPTNRPTRHVPQRYATMRCPDRPPNVADRCVPLPFVPPCAPSNPVGYASLPA